MLLILNEQNLQKIVKLLDVLKQNFLKLKLIRLSFHFVLYLLLSEFIDQVRYCNYLALKIGLTPKNRSSNKTVINGKIDFIPFATKSNLPNNKCYKILKLGQNKLEYLCIYGLV